MSTVEDHTDLVNKTVIKERTKKFKRNYNVNNLANSYK